MFALRIYRARGAFEPGAPVPAPMLDVIVTRDAESRRIGAAPEIRSFTVIA